tara:strand:+ start:310 stop:564 length:255 start_codon:yes stop_codon:yes gene_type:complete
MNKWKQKTRPFCLEKRFEFDSYEGTRDFLDLLGNYSEEKDRFPDISFGKTYVNITIRPEDESSLSEEDHVFASDIDQIFSEGKI